MGIMEWLTALTLGRGHYEEEVLQTPGDGNQNGQLYNDRGYPRNPETKRRERENVRAANEVMLVTGVVENSEATRTKKRELESLLMKENMEGLRLLETGRFALIGGVWGVLGLRQRILLYKSYASMSLPAVLKHESEFGHSIPQFFITGLAPVMAYQALELFRDWNEFPKERADSSAKDDDWLSTSTENDDSLVSRASFRMRWTAFRTRDYWGPALDWGVSYVAFVCSLYAILQHLHLISPNRFFPPLLSFIPFSRTSPFQLPPTPNLGVATLLAWTGAALRNVLPFFVYTSQGRLKYNVSKRIQRLLYYSLPHPEGEFSGLEETPGSDAQEQSQFRPVNGSDDDWATQRALALRALEGLPASEQPTPRSRTFDRDTAESTDEEDDELNHTTLISFDVEATEPVETSLGTWSAELRSAIDQKPPGSTQYRMTSVTMLPAILATEALGDIVTWIIMLPFDAWCVRLLARDYRAHAGMGIEDIYSIGMRPFALGNLFVAATLQLGISVFIWTGFSLGARWIARKYRRAEDAGEEAPAT